MKYQELDSLGDHRLNGQYGAAMELDSRQSHGDLFKTFDQPEYIINTSSVNADGVAFSFGGDGSLASMAGAWVTTSKPWAPPFQYFSLDAEPGVLRSTFDETGIRRITDEADKTIKICKMT